MLSLADKCLKFRKFQAIIYVWLLGILGRSKPSLATDKYKHNIQAIVTLDLLLNTLQQRKSVLTNFI